jgi:hypothetical protein
MEPNKCVSLVPGLPAFSHYTIIECVPFLAQGPFNPNSATVEAHSRAEAIADRISPLVSFNGLVGILLTSF